MAYLSLQGNTHFISAVRQAADGRGMFLHITPVALSKNSSQLMRKLMPVPTGTLSRVSWDCARAGVFYSLEAITSPGMGTTASTRAALKRFSPESPPLGATLGKAQEAGEGQAEQSQGQGGGCLAFHWETANLSWEQLELGENHLLSALLPGPRSAEGARAKAAKGQGETSRSSFSAGCPSYMTSHQHREPWLSVLCLWESPWL